MQLSVHEASTTDLGERLTGLFTTLGRAIADLERGSALSRLEFAVLVHLARGDGLRSTDLAEAEGLDPSTMSRRLTALGEQGLVRREPDPEDRRASRLHLTDTGRHRLREVRARRVELVTDSLADWSEADRTALAHLLGRLDESLAAGLRRAACEGDA